MSGFCTNKLLSTKESLFETLHFSVSNPSVSNFEEATSRNAKENQIFICTTQKGSIVFMHYSHCVEYLAFEDWDVYTFLYNETVMMFSIAFCRDLHLVRQVSAIYETKTPSVKEEGKEIL
jgi:hypothetical protein